MEEHNIIKVEGLCKSFGSLQVLNDITTEFKEKQVVSIIGPSGGGKSELLQDVHRVSDGRVLLGTNLENGERDYLHMSDTCTIHPVTDDMAICHPSFQAGSGKLALYDGEDGWFLRVDGITEYGSDPMYERITIESEKPLMFFNIDGVPGATCLIWDHTMDSNGKPFRVDLPNWNRWFALEPNNTCGLATRHTIEFR